MAYIISQSAGKLANAAKQYNDLRIAGDMPGAIALYRKVTGDTRPLAKSYEVRTYGDNTLPEMTSLWWIYNADSVIRGWHGLSLTVIDKALPKGHFNDLDYARTVCALATRLVGGHWVYCYEY